MAWGLASVGIRPQPTEAHRVSLLLPLPLAIKNGRRSCNKPPGNTLNAAGRATALALMRLRLTLGTCVRARRRQPCVLRHLADAHRFIEKDVVTGGEVGVDQWGGSSIERARLRLTTAMVPPGGQRRSSTNSLGRACDRTGAGPAAGACHHPTHTRRSGDAHRLGSRRRQQQLLVATDSAAGCSVR